MPGKLTLKLCPANPMPEVTQVALVTLDPSGVVPGHPTKTPPLMPKFEKAGGRV
ncbi:MAG TPA: hypothetical protein VGH38_02995 [Bryobacteraceae bacterium]